MKCKHSQVNKSTSVCSKGLFLESPSNFSAPKSNIYKKILRKQARIPAFKPVHFDDSVRWQFYHIICKTSFLLSRPRSWNCSFSGPLIIETLEKRPPGPRHRRSMIINWWSLSSLIIHFATLKINWGLSLTSP